MAEKNPHPPETPEWQLFELAASADAQARAFADDAERSQQKSKAQREKAERFRAALEKLIASPPPSPHAGRRG